MGRRFQSYKYAVLGEARAPPIASAPFCSAPTLFSNGSRMSGKKDVTGVAAIHYALRQVNAGAGDIGVPVEINYLAYRAAMDPHSYLNLGVFS